MSFKFRKHERLKSKKLIEQLFNEGKTVGKFPFKLVYNEYISTTQWGIKAGFSVPKKKFNKAVHRNKIKRLLREAYRLHRNPYFNNIEGNYALMFLYLGDTIPNFEQVEQGMIKLLETFKNEILDEKNK